MVVNVIYVDTCITCASLRVIGKALKNMVFYQMALYLRYNEMNSFEKLFMRVLVIRVLDDDQRIHKIGQNNIPEWKIKRDMLECLK